MRSDLCSLIYAFVLASFRSNTAEAVLVHPLSLHEGFLTRDEIDGLAHNIDIDTDSVGTYYGPTVLSPEIVHRLKELGGTCTMSAGGYMNETSGQMVHSKSNIVGEAVMTMVMMTTTDFHKDCFVPQVKGRVVKDDVAFIFLESDPHATFVHGDGTIPEKTVQIPVVAGNLVRFRGDIPHHTVVPAGSQVRIAGPFHLNSLQYVGSCPQECDDATDCDGGLYYNKCRCFPITSGSHQRRLRQQASKDRAMEKLKLLSNQQSFLRSVAASRDLLGWDDPGVCACKEAIGACVLKDGSKCYDNVDLSQCIRGLFGLFLGAGSNCSAGSIETIDYGACCFHDNRQCLNVQESYCNLMTPGYFLGHGTDCDHCPSWSELGACCLMDGCEYLPQNICEDVKKGVYKGDSTTCKNHCYGACCGTDQCEIMTETAASINCSSNFNGTGSTCMLDSCPAECNAAFTEAQTVAFPAPNRVITTSGDTAKGKDYKDYIPECGATILHTEGVWYNLPAPSSNNGGRKVTVSTCDSDIPGAFADYDTSLSVYEGACNDLSCVGGNSDSSNCSESGTSTVSWCAQPAKTYRVFVHGFASYCSLAKGTYTLAIKDDGPCGPSSRDPPITSSNTTGQPIPTGSETTTSPPPQTATTALLTQTTTATTKNHPIIGSCAILPPGCPNPCFEGISGFEAYQPYCPQQTQHYEATRYIHCDHQGGCFVKECCDPDTYWNDEAKACDHIGGAQSNVTTYPTSPATKVHPTLGTCDAILPTGCNNPCYSRISGFEAYQPFCPEENGGNDYNRTRYILCDYHGGCFVNECCDPDTYWNNEAKACDHINP